MKIQELLAKPEAWTRYVCARDVDGNVTASDSSDATCYCIVGAAMKCYYMFTLNSSNGLKFFDVLDIIYKEIGINPNDNNGIGIGIWNDAPERTHQDVLNLAIKLNI